LKFTTELEIKFPPLTISVKAAAPAVAEFGTSELIVGAGLLAALMVKVTPLEVPPPGVGFVTVTEGVPTEATSGAVIAAVN
jgi:hypothetical protein